MGSCKRKATKAVIPLKSEISHYQMKLIGESKICVAIPGRKKGLPFFLRQPFEYLILMSIN